MTSEWIGLCDYNYGIERQSEFIQSDQNQNVKTFGLEHHLVATLGYRLKSAEGLLPSSFPQNKIVKVKRGGQLTIHNPGQLVIYPVTNLRVFNIGVRCWVHYLLSVTKKSLYALGTSDVTINTDSHVGVYTNNKKVASVGVHITKGWSTHGLSINVNNCLNFHNKAVCCGVETPKITTLYNESIQVSLTQLFNIWCTEFKQGLVDITTRDC